MTADVHREMMAAHPVPPEHQAIIEEAFAAFDKSNDMKDFESVMWEHKLLLQRYEVDEFGRYKISYIEFTR